MTHKSYYRLSRWASNTKKKKRRKIFSFSYTQNSINFSPLSSLLFDKLSLIVDLTFIPVSHKSRHETIVDLLNANIMDKITNSTSVKKLSSINWLILGFPFSYTSHHNDDNVIAWYVCCELNVKKLFIKKERTNKRISLFFKFNKEIKLLPVPYLQCQQQPLPHNPQ